jgi:hypothetical protein
LKQSWRDAILAEFVPQLAPLTLVADPDGLLADERIQATLQALGFELVEYQDSIAFRYLFETTIRPHWEAGEQREWVIVLRATPKDLQQLPYDLLENGRLLSLSLSSLFPGLTYNEVAALDAADLDALYIAQARFKPGSLGENGTRDFILRHVFGIEADLVNDEAAMLTVLLRLHMVKRPLPGPFADRFLQQVQNDGRFAEWPLAALVADPSTLFSFLQERWPIYLDQLTPGTEARLHDTLTGQLYNLKYPGPLLLPFDNPDIRAFVDTLFLEGKLRPVTHPLVDKLKPLWVSVGLQFDPAVDRERRLTGLLNQLEVSLPTAVDARHTDWFSFAAAWAEAILLRHLSLADLSQPISQQFDDLQIKLDDTFTQWLAHRYKYLSTLPPHPPVMVHHIPRSLARQVQPRAQEKLALIVMDGMAFDQWLIVREMLLEQISDMRFREDAVFAWIPTLTAVSRQALFAGNSPIYFPGSISTTAKDSALWSLFWEEKGLLSAEIGYERKLRTAVDLDRVEQLLTRPKMRVVGLVVDQVDHMMHGMTLGLPGLHQQLRLWLNGGFLGKLIKRLVQDNYQIVLTSDHGNVAARGIGRPSEQSLADLRGERVRIYPNEILRSRVQQTFPTAVAWSPEGLPPGFYPLLAPDRSAFIPTGETTVTHGGNLLEEVVVPYVKVLGRVM